MTGPPTIELAGVVKQYPALRPLRVSKLEVSRSDRLVLAGLDAGAAEMLIHLVTGAALPDEGDVRIAGRSTREIATDTEWLASLDRFGIVTARAVLLDKLPVASNIALPMTLTIDPVPDDVMRRVEALADRVGLGNDRLAAVMSTLSAEERVRVHLARALAMSPEIVLLEHPTVGLSPEAAEAIGAALGRLSESRGPGWVALSEDERFARASGGTRLRLAPATGTFTADGFWRRFF